jgi:hypothetical protein
MFRISRVALPVLVVLLILPFRSASAAGPPKVADLLPQHFQITISASWNDLLGNQSNLDTASEPFVIEEGKTALLNYVACRAYHAKFSGSTDASFRLAAEVQGELPGEVTILAGEMEPESAFLGGPHFESSADVISACIGSKCNSLGDDTYVSLILYANRDSGSGYPEQVNCLISGLIY